MIIPFDTMKTIQAAGVLLKEHAGQMSRLRLLKLVYIADRESLTQTLRPITGDRAAALDHGPVPSVTYDLLKREHSDSVIWDQFIEQVGPQEHRLIRDPGVNELSRYEIEKLRSVAEQRREKNDYDIAVETHEFEEWKRNRPPAGGRCWIPLDDLLAAIKLEGSKNRILEAIEDDAAFDAALAAVRKALQAGDAGSNMNAGDVFRFTRSADKHRWVVLSEPVLDAERILVVNITTFDPLEDRSCILEREDHPSLTGRSLVNYPRARVLTNAELDSFVRANLVEMLGPLKPEVLARIREASMDSTRMKLDHADILIDQGLVE